MKRLCLVISVTLLTGCPGDRVGPSVGDAGIAGAQITQAVQNTDGTIPQIIGGNASVVNVLLSSSKAMTDPVEIVLRILDAGTGAVVRSDTQVLSGIPQGTATYAAPSAQFFIPAGVLRGGLTWEVLRDPRHLLPDDSLADDRFPRGGPAALPAVTTPAVKIRFIPIVLTSHGNSTGVVSAGNLGPYLQTLLSVTPLGAVSTSVGPALASAANFGSPPSGGQAAFWQQVLSEVDAARVADVANADAHWVGVVAPPPGFNFTAVGGFAYIPASYGSFGPNTRSSVLVNVGWFVTPTQSRDLVAHELSHNFGRRHAPCGGAASPLDGSYPFADGTTHVTGHDVFQRANGSTATAVTVAASTGDVMGYCFPVWTSTYTYEAVLAFRGQTPAALALPEQVLMIRGSVDSGRVQLSPAIAMTAPPTTEARGGAYVVEGFAEDGGRLFAQAVAPAILDHSTARHFTVAVPLTRDIESRLATIRVRGPSARAELSRVALNDLAASGTRVPVLERRGGVVRVACANPAARALVVQDAAGGRVLGMASAAEMSVVAVSGERLRLSCSDGVRSTRSEIVAP